jgi:hypothetical protein
MTVKEHVGKHGKLGDLKVYTPQGKTGYFKDWWYSKGHVIGVYIGSSCVNRDKLFPFECTYNEFMEWTVAEERDKSDVKDLIKKR